MPGLDVSQHELIEWLDSPTGQSLYQQERLFCFDKIFKLPGYRAAQLGVSPGHSLLDGLGQSHKCILSPMVSEQASCVCDYESLPLPSNTLDVIVLHHALEFSPRPHNLLNEAARVVVAGGHIIIVSFNPYSFFGLTKWAAGMFSKRQLWRHHSLRTARLIDWLQLIGFQVVTTRPRGKPATTDTEQNINGAQLPGWIRRQIAVRAFSVIVARKQVAPLSPVRQLHWSGVNVPVFGGLKSVGNDKT